MVAINQQDAKQQTQQLVKNQTQNVYSLLERMKPQIERALPRHCRADRMLRIVTTELRKSPKLGECDPMSLLGAVIKASQLGLEPGDALGHAYLIPYKKQCQLIVGYRGFIALSRRSGEILSICAHVVRNGDFFDVGNLADASIVHKPLGMGFGNMALPDGYTLDSAILAAYAVAKLKGGGSQADIKPRWKLDQTKKFSLDKAYNPNDSKLPWNAFFEEMARKTAVRALFKYLPVSVEIDRAIALDEAAERGEAQNNYQLETPEGGLIDIPYTPTDAGEEDQPDQAANGAATASTVTTGPKLDDLRGRLKVLIDRGVALGMAPEALGISHPFEREEKRTVLYIETAMQWLAQKEKAASPSS